MDTSIAITLKASDYDGTIVEWLVDQPNSGTLSGTCSEPRVHPERWHGGHGNVYLQVRTYICCFFLIHFALCELILLFCNYRVRDDTDELSNSAAVSLTVRDCNMIDIFQVPAAFPVFSGAYNYVHVSEDGPSLDNMKTPAHNVQWQNPGLHQFSLELEVEPYYKDLLSCMTNQALSGSSASFTLTGCGISGLGWRLLDHQPERQRGFGWRRTTGGRSCSPTMQHTSPSFAARQGLQDRRAPLRPVRPRLHRRRQRASQRRPIRPLLAPRRPVRSLWAPRHLTQLRPTRPLRAQRRRIRRRRRPNTPPPRRRDPPVTPAPTTLGPTTSNPTTPSPTIPNPTTPNPTTPNPTPNPTPLPTPNPTPAPTPGPTAPSGGTLCCAARHQGYQTCSTDSYCNASEGNCANCSGKFVVAPLQQTGCCSWGGNNCSGIDPMTNAGCHFFAGGLRGQLRVGIGCPFEAASWLAAYQRKLSWLSGESDNVGDWIEGRLIVIRC